MNTGQNRTSNRFRTGRNENRQETRRNQANFNEFLDVTTKSGTNQFHGSIYGLLESGRLDSDPFFNKQIGLPTPDLHRYWGGAELGGPIVKQKLFFYASYQYTRARDQFKSLTSYFVPAGLTDDRSVPTLETLTGVASLDPVAVALLQAKVSSGQYLISSPLNPKSGGANVNFLGPASKFNAAQANGNLDYHLSDSDVISTKYYYQHDPTESPFSSGPLLGFPQAFQSGSQVFSLENNHIFSPKLTWDQKFGFLREIAESITSQPFGPNNIGGSGASINLFGSTLFPGIDVGNFDGTGNSLSIGPTSNFSNTGFAQDTFEGTTNLNWVLGNHTLSFGANYDFSQLNILNRANQVASIDFTSLTNFVKAGGPVRAGAGHSEYFQGASNRYYRAPQVGAYAQDHWRLTSKLNVTAGIRYDNDGGLYEKYGNLVNFDPTQYSYNAATDTIENAGLIVAGNNKLYHTPGASNSTLKQGQWGIAPRVGVAYSLTPKLVLRGGFGLYYDRGEFFTEFSPSAGGGFNGPFGVTLQPPFVQPVVATASGTLDNPFGTTAPTIDTNPADFIKNLPNMTALINHPFSAAGEPYLFGAYGLNNKLPYTENWSSDVQWQARKDVSATLGYTGNHSQRQTIPVPFNQPQVATPQAPLYANGLYPQTNSYGYQWGPDELYNTNTGGNTDLRTPFIGYSPNSVSWNTVGIANYDALLASIHKTVSHGLDMYVAYTYSHSLDDSSGFGLFYNGNNPQDLRSGYASSDFDQTHTTAISFSYQVPKLKSGSKTLKVLTNGWGMNGYSILQSGQPYNVYDFSGTVGSIYFSSNDFLTNPVLPLAPGVTKKQALTGHSGAFGANDAAFNPSSFVYPTLAPGTDGVPADDPYESGFANGERNIFRSAFQKSANIAFVKQTKITEKANLRLSAEFLNITNTPSFDAPGNAFTGAPNFGPPFTPIGPGADPATFSSQGVGIVTNPIGGARQLQFTGILSF
jgi:TonB dependent receptor